MNTIELKSYKFQYLQSSEQNKVLKDDIIDFRSGYDLDKKIDFYRKIRSFTNSFY